MVRNVFYIAFTFILFYGFILIMDTLTSYSQALNVNLTMSDFIPHIIFGPLIINVITFSAVFLSSYKKVFTNKKVIINKLVIFFIVEVFLVLAYIEIIDSFYLT